jgi:hypothetical protein
MPYPKPPAIVILFAFCIAIILILDRGKTDHFFPTDLDKLNAYSKRDSPVQTTGLEVKQSLVKYALDLINADRATHNLPQLNLSNNMAAQNQADEFFTKKIQYPSHWSTDGMKPYMKYSMYNGTGYVQQNIVVTAYDNLTIEKCKERDLICHEIDYPPYQQILQSERSMMFNDTLCCQDRHKYNILDKRHTDVSIGLSYSKDYFIMVQNFENNYINFTKPLADNNGRIEIEGNMKKDYDIENIAIYYDSIPSIQEFRQNRNANSYDLGKLVALIVKPAPLLTQYRQPSNYSLIEAGEWVVKDQLININFGLTPALENKGVYTVVVYLKHKVDNETFPVTDYSIFRN